MHLFIFLEAGKLYLYFSILTFFFANGLPCAFR